MVSAPIYLQIIIGFVLFATIFVTLERKLPSRRQKIFRRGWITDVNYFVLGCLAGQFSSAVSLAAIILACHLTGLRYSHMASHQPGWLQFLEILLLFDFLGYSFHRAMHRIPWLWRFHRIHHSSQEMDWLVNVRVHPVDKILSDCVQLIPTMCLGFSPLPLLAFAILLGVQGFLNHSNLRINFGPLRWIVASPQFHHWHHSNDTSYYDRNFAPHLVLFDLLFGTARLPRSNRMPASYGMTEKVPEGLLSQLIHPFRRKVNKTMEGPAPISPFEAGNARVPPKSSIAPKSYSGGDPRPVTFFQTAICGSAPWGRLSKSARSGVASSAADRPPTYRLPMSLTSSLFDYLQYFMAVSCPECAAIGKILWEGSGERKTLVQVSGQFYERLCRLPPHPIELVCRSCGATQLE